MKTIFLTVLILFTVLIVFHSRNSEAALQNSPANSCIDCHKDLPEEPLSKPVKLWASSVHAEVGNTCEGCHGGNPKDVSLESMAKKNRFYANPKAGDIVGFCGKCHQELADFYTSSVHGVTESLTCIDCHGSHAIRRIGANIINQEKCSACHDYKLAEQLKNILQELHQQFHQINAKLKTVKKYPTNAVQNELDNTWNQLRKVRMISHTFNLNKIEGESKKVTVSLAKIGTQIDYLAEQKKSRSFGGGIIILVFLVLGGLTYFYNKEILDN